MQRSDSTGAVERRLWKDHPRARRTFAAATALSLSAVVCWIAFALLLSARSAVMSASSYSGSGHTGPTG